MLENQLGPMWSALSHRNIVPLLGIYTNVGPLPQIKVPYYRNGSIDEYNVGANSSTKLRQCLQIAAGLSYLHKKGFHHGNICPVRLLSGDPTPFAFQRLTFSIDQHYGQGRWWSLHC
jgi:serine/threonine protein kinase